MFRLFVPLLALGLAFLSLPAGAAEKAAPKAKMVFVANTGLEDLSTLSSSLRHAAAAKKSDEFEEVVWMVYGRAIVALDPSVSAVPDSLRKQIEEAKKAGVRLVACAHAMKKYDIGQKDIPAGVEVVANAIDELGRLVARGYSVIRY